MSSRKLEPSPPTVKPSTDVVVRQKPLLQRRAAGVNETLDSPGSPLEGGPREEMEARFGHDFSAVRVHTDERAAESAGAVSALAYTVGPHIVFGAGQYAPGTQAGRHLLAHELTHTIQQSSGTALQRQAAAGEPADAAEAEAGQVADQVSAAPAAAGLIVEDDASPGSGQMHRNDFLDELQSASCAAADAELARAGRSTDGCPYIEQAFPRYRAMRAAQVETAVRRYVDPV